MTGKQLWVFNTEGAIWGSPMVADGKVYLCNELGYAFIIPVSRTLDEKKVIQHDLDGVAAYCSPVVANGTLYLMTHNSLFAIK